MKKHILILLAVAMSSCNFMDVIPDDVATINNIFSSRERAEAYLFSCYANLPAFGTANEPGMVLGDATWYQYNVSYRQPHWEMMRAGNTVISPTFNFWTGGYAGIRICNTFLENIHRVPDMISYEKDRWAAEVKFLKAFYHFWLFQMYGPIPIVDENLPINATSEEVRLPRVPVDDVVDYIVNLINEAVPDLPLMIDNEVSELGRITQAIALSVKAKVLVSAASPLFNGNTAYAQFKDKDGRALFDQDTSDEAKRLKWERAAVACKEAIDYCHDAGHGLYVYSSGTEPVSEYTRRILQTSTVITDKWNEEHIWGKALGVFFQNRSIQVATMPSLHADHLTPFVFLSPTLKMAELFYSKNGVPIDEDKEYDYAGRYTLQRLEADDTYHQNLLQPGVTTAKLHQNRETRFYGALGVDGGRWFGLGRTTEAGQWPLNLKAGQQEGGLRDREKCSITGFYIKKFVHLGTSYNGTTLVQQTYDWPIFRLADLYLLYAEALNESDAPYSDVTPWIDEVRNRAGLNGVADSWDEFSKTPNRYKTKEGMRNIIQRERNIELAFEGHRFWDLRRWGLIMEYVRQPIQGWNVDGASDDFYQVVTFDNLSYSLRDILWPIQESELRVNNNLIQNPGW